MPRARNRTAQPWDTTASWVVLAVSLGLAAQAFAGTPAADCPPAGTDSFESNMNVILTIPNVGTQAIDLTGPVTVVRGEPRVEDGVSVIDTEIVAMELSGTFLSSPISLRQSPENASAGQVRAQDPSSCFLADSFFDVFVEVDVQGFNDPLVNLAAVRLEAANLAKLPPLFDTYTHPPPAIPLVALGTTGPVIATVEGESSHSPVQRPTFSIAAGGSLEPAAGYEPPTPPQVTVSRAGLGLQAGDDLDALSYGLDAIDAKPFTILAFSVDPASAGSPGSGVAQEATTGEQESAEYVTFVNATNQLLVPGDLLVSITGDSPPGDDVDALTDQQANVVDTNDDQVPDAPVFLSLAPGSPTLTALAASPADILVTQAGTASVFATAADIGLVAGDDIDAMCLMKSGLPNVNLRAGSGPPQPPFPGPQIFDYLLFSLAAGSPTLAAQGHTAADLFVTDFSNSRPALTGQPLQLYAEDFELGLLSTDELNALKCLRPAVMIEIADDGDLDGPGNETGCEDDERNVGVVLETGISNHDGDHTLAPGLFGFPNFFEIWSVQNPNAGDLHGPFAYPGTAAAAFLPFGDPANPLHANFVGGPGDNCGLPHVHESFFGIPLFDPFGNHADPDLPACGHGVFVPGPFRIASIPTRRSDAEIFLRALVDYLNTLAGLPPGFQASWRRYHGETTLPIGQCTTLETRRWFLTLSGIAIVQLNLRGYGDYTGENLGDPESSMAALIPDPSVSAPLPIRFGDPVRTVAPTLVPEPAALQGGVAALLVLAALGCLARGREPRRAAD